MLEMLRQGRRGVYPISRTDALHKWVEGALALIAPGQGMRAHAAETIYTLAWEMQVARCLVWPVSDAFRILSEVRGSRGYDSETLYRNYLQHDLLNEVGEISLRFAYSPVQAYCCAKAIIGRFDRERILGDITSMLGMPERLRWWEETLVFVCGLMAEEDEVEALLDLLTCIIYSVDLLEGEQVFVAARCLLECRQQRRDLAELHQHVMSALRWRTHSQNEPRPAYRVLATQLLSRLADPEAIVDMAELVYKKARLNLSDVEDYEYSSIRMAAAIGLKRMKSRKRVDETLATIHPQLVSLFANWEHGNSDVLIEQFTQTDDAGIQAIVALALGDLASQSTLSQVDEDRKDVLDCLIAAFKDKEMPSSVRWAVTDALAMVDTTTISSKVIQPALKELPAREPGEQVDWLGRDKCLAYLIGLIRAQEPAAHAFLVDHCLRSSDDLPLWLTAIEALGNLANLDDRQLLTEIAKGTFDGRSLAIFFPDSHHRYHIRRKAIGVLAEIGDEETAKALREGGVEQDKQLTRAFYRATSDIYQRLE
jgi:HEAT repeat protein